MFAYNAGGVTDRSGELIAQGANNAAMLQAEAMGNFGQNMGNALAQIGEAYSERKQLEAKASSYDDIGKILGTAMFSNNPDAMGALGNLQKEKDPRRKVMGYETLFGLVGPMGNYMMANRSSGIREQGQQIQQNAPYVAADIKNRQNIAGGNVPHGGGGGMAPVEPPLPPYSPAPVSQPPAPSAAIPGGDESMRRYNEWKSKRGS